jgi:hypothetical protein
LSDDNNDSINDGFVVVDETEAAEMEVGRMKRTGELEDSDDDDDDDDDDSNNDVHKTRTAKKFCKVHESDRLAEEYLDLSQEL